METILVTGGAGFIGVNFVRYILENISDVKIVNLDALTYAGNLVSLRNIPNPKRHHFVHGSIEDTKVVKHLLNAYEITKIVHFAAETHVDRSILHPESFLTTNILGTFNLLSAAYEIWKEKKILEDENVRFHHISTDEVFGSLAINDAPFDEKTAYAPNSPYSASKASSDHFVRVFCKTYSLPVTITNCSNNYGPFQYPEKLIPLIILNALEKKELPVYGTGAQIRDWLYVQDHCEAVWKVLQRGIAGETYCIGGDSQPTNLELVGMLCDILDEVKPVPGFSYKSLINFVADRPGHDFRYAVNSQKIKRELGWVPFTELKDGLRKTVNWYCDNFEWVYEVKSSSDYSTWMAKTDELRRLAK